MTVEQGNVHVYGSPEKRLADDERLCSGDDKGQLVVFHADDYIGSVNGFVYCFLCGETDGPRC